ncbi:flagellar hook-associated protein FlgK [Fulvimarina sp. 2208YS6-2-32]|uniref:Flagellar hook-associated protein 1 n=1 Tax=Fulvimarina uroteuthidis TaxID=3098149 RepID=A0ABU5HYW9_9HYPH|nr:flagellar hook-associated protein FlgK [Fulvimarina sp. 2208YS6-2-32]MDY8108087.1 flagellar hook-associated protein FlgK [Fulvimarina sp. 2208YS6-2-32]
MSLLSVFNNARSSLSVTSQQSALIARNVANADDPTATRKYANQISEKPGAVKILSIAQSSDPALYRTMVKAQASHATNETMAKALDRVRDVIGDVDAPTSPSAKIAALKGTLTDLAASPENTKLQRAAIDAAHDMASSLNNATKAVQTMRTDANTELAQGADRLNTLLGDLETVNNKVVGGTVSGKDVTDEIDQRDRLVSEISSLVGVSTRYRANNDLVLSTDSGIVMFETRARSVEFANPSNFNPAIPLDPATPLPAAPELKIDGVSIGTGSSMAVRDGSLVAAIRIRDEVGVEMQRQFNQISSTLAGKTFAEDGAASLFELSANGFVSVAASVDYRVGGDPTKLRDGNINPGSTALPGAGEAGYATRLNELIDRFSDVHTLANGESGTLSDLAAGSMSWFEGKRAEARDGASYQSIMVSRARETLSNETGVNLDEEMSRLMELERSYQAASKLIQTVGDLLDRLLAIR